MNKIFLTDVDGIIFNFIRTFEIWIKTKEYHVTRPQLADDNYYLKIEDWLGVTKAKAQALVEEFFNTDFSKHFITFKDSVDVIHKLKNEGWNFVAVTAIGGGELAKKHRMAALDYHFGKYVFSDVLTVPPFSSKEEILKTFSPTLWVDDSPMHIVEGIAAGHFTFHMKREGDTRQTPEEDAIEVTDWHGIYDWIHQ